MAKDSSNPKHSVSVGDKHDVELVFRKYDANGDGRISLPELGSIFKALGTAMTADELKRVMSEIDTDGDGFIDLKEFTEFHRGGDSANDFKELRDAFDLYDKDKNGKISAAELLAVLKQLGENCSLKDCKKMISSVDVDGDGCVNFDEFKKMMSRP